MRSKNLLRFIAPCAAGLALALPLHAEPEVPSAPPATTTMPETPSDVKAPPADAEKTASGLFSKVLQAGKGEKKPGPRDTVTVHYSGWTTDGKLVDRSVQRNEPTSFPLNGVIKGWTEGLQLMPVGSEYRLVIPAELAYGENAPPQIGPNATLIFDVKLISIETAAAAPAPAAPEKK